MLTVDPPRVPTLPQMEDGSDFPTTLPPTHNTPISIPDGDAKALWDAIDTAPGGTRIEVAGPLPLPSWRWPKRQNRGSGWVVVCPKPAVMQQLDASIGNRRVTEADYGLLPTLHATSIAQQSGFVFGPGAPRSDTGQRDSSTNLWFHRIGFNLEEDVRQSHHAMHITHDCIAMDQCLLTRTRGEQGGKPSGGNGIVLDAWDYLLRRSTVTGFATFHGGESQTFLTFSRATNFWLDWTHLDQATQSLYLYDTNHITGKTTQNATVTNCIIGDPFGKYTQGQWVGKRADGKACFEIKSCDGLLFENNLVGPQRGHMNGGQIVRLSPSRSAPLGSKGNSGIDAVGKDWMIRNNRFGPSPGEFQIYSLIKFVGNGETPDGLERVHITDNVLVNVRAGGGGATVELLASRYGFDQAGDNSSNNILIARNISYGTANQPRAFMRLHGGGGSVDIDAHRLPGPFVVRDNIVACGGWPALTPIDFADNPMPIDPALAEAFVEAEWTHNCHIGGATKINDNPIPQSPTIVTVPDLASVRFSDPNNDDYLVGLGSPVEKKASDGEDMGLKYWLDFKDAMANTKAGTPGTEPPPPPPPPPPVDNPPGVLITSPANGATIEANQPIDIAFTASDDVGLKVAALVIDGIQVDSNSIAGLTYLGAFRYMLTPTGSRSIQVDVYDTKDQKASNSITVNVTDPPLPPPLPPSNLDQRVTNLEKAVSDLSDRTDDTEQDIIALRLHIQSAENDIAALEGRAAAQSDRIKDVEGKQVVVKTAWNTP